MLIIVLFKARCRCLREAAAVVDAAVAVAVAVCVAASVLSVMMLNAVDCYVFLCLCHTLLSLPIVHHQFVY